MKIRSKFGIAFTAGISAIAIRWLIQSLRARIYVEEPWMDPFRPDCPRDFLFAVWHDGLLAPTVLYGGLGQFALISQSRDGELIAQIAARLGWRVIRGSSSKGSMTALRQMLDLGSRHGRVHLAVTADGPRGPRHRCKHGAVYAAAKTGMAIIPVGVALERPWRARSWDRFQVPRPFSRAVLFGGRPMEVPRDADRATIERCRVDLEAAIQRAERVANELLHADRPTLHQLTPRRHAA